MIYPSSLFQEDDGESSDFYNKSFNNAHLRVGIVLSVYDIEDEQNILKASPEYDVMTLEQESDMGVNTTIYKNCLTMDRFGGVADYFQMKLRPVKDVIKTKTQVEFASETGSVVLILCLDGMSEKAVIVGGMQNPSKQILTKEKGHHLEGEYNGVNYQVNKDGELTVTFRSKTNDDGTISKEEQDKPEAERAGGSFLKLDKTGSIELNDNKTESIKIDKTAQTISIKSEKTTSVVTNDEINLTSKNSTNIKAKDLIANAEGRISLSAKSPSMFKCEAELTFDAPTVKIQGTDMIMAQASQIQLLGNQVIVGNGAVPAVVSTTTFLGIGNMGGPVISTAIGPYSSSVLIGL
jgi:hypothetical protein